MVGLLSLVLVTLAAFAVDLGMQRVARTDMQSLTDVIALDLARELGERSVSDFTASTPTIQELADESRDRNTTTLGSTPTVQIDLGYLDNDFEFVEMSGDDVPSAVRVTATTNVNFAFGVMQSGSATRSAVSEQTQDAACFEMGSFAAALSLGDSVLGPLADFLGLGADLSLVSYQNLLGADVSLLDVAVAPTIGTPDALLAPSGVEVGDLIEATIHALNQEPSTPANGAAITVLQGLLATNSGLELESIVKVAEVVSVDVGNAAALAAQFNVLELIGASLGLANGANFIASSVPVDLSSVGLGTGSLSISAVQGARYACGRTWPTPADDCDAVRAGKGACARQSQVQFALGLTGADVPLISTSTQVLSTSLKALIGPITLTGGVGNAKGVLQSVDECGPPDRYTVDVSSGLLGVHLQVPLNVSGKVTLDVGAALGPLQSVVGNVLNLPGLIGGLLGGTEYEYRNYRVEIDIASAGTILTAESNGTTSNDDAPLESPTNDRSGTAVRVPANPKAPALGTLSVPSTLLEGKITARLTYEWRSRNAALGFVPAGPWSAWIPNTTTPAPGSSSGPLFVGDLTGLAGLPAPLGAVGSTIDSTLQGVTTALNSQVVSTVNSTLNSTLLPLLGLSGTGADIYSVSRPLCGGPPRLTG